MSRASAPSLARTFSIQAIAALAVTALVLLSNFQLSQANRKLRGAEEALNPFAPSCGYFNNSDPLDPGVAHQPCYGPDNTIQFCWCVGFS